MVLLLGAAFAGPALLARAAVAAPPLCTAGDTRFGVLRGEADGATGSLVLYRQGYKVGIARHGRRSFDVLQPHYAANDPNCCPSAFRMRRYTWTGSHFKTGRARKLKTAPRRFYRP